MEETSEIRFDGVIDHIAVESQDLKADVHDYKRVGFRVESLYADWALDAGRS